MAVQMASRTLIFWLALISLSAATALGESEVTEVAEQTEEKVSPVDKWRNDFGDFVRRARIDACKAFDDCWRPKKELFDEVQRYHKWHTTYSKLCDKQKSEQSLCLPPNDLLLREYAKTDGELFADKREQEFERAALANEQPDELSIEKVDYLFELIGRLIIRLEALQEAIEKGDQPMPNETDKRAVEESMERLRRIAVKTAKQVAMGEAIELGRIAAFKMFARMLAANPAAPGTPLGFLAALFELLANPDLSVHAQYLMQLRARAAMTALSPLNKMIMAAASNIRGKDTDQEEEATTTGAPEVDVPRAQVVLGKAH